MKELFKNVFASVSGVREKKFFRVMWYITTVLIVVWSILSGVQLVVNCTIIGNNSKIVSRSSEAVGIKKVENGYLYLQNDKKVKESEITEYVKTKSGMYPRYLEEGTVSQPLSEVGTIQYAVQFFSLVLTSFVCLAMCNYMAGLLARWKRVMLRFVYVVLLFAYILVGIIYTEMFSYIENIYFYYIVGGMIVIMLIMFNTCLFSIRLEEEDDVIEE